MDNIIFEKIWQDNEIIELKISAKSEFVSAYQCCYIQDKKLEEIAGKLCNYVEKYDGACYVEFGKKEGNFYVNSELGLIEQLGMSLKDLITEQVGYEVCLCR